MANAIDNAFYKIMRETKNNWNGRPPQQTAPCPRCSANMIFNPVGDGRMGILLCQRCKYKQMVRLG